MRSLKSKIMIPIFIIATVGFLLLSFVEYIEARKIIVGYVEMIAEEKVEKLCENVEDKMKNSSMQMNLLASLECVKDLNYEEFEKFIFHNKDLFSIYEVNFIADKQGNYLATNGTSGSIIDTDYYLTAISGKTVISRPGISNFTKSPIIITASPIFANNGTVVGIVGGTINLKTITDIINCEKLGENGYAYMIDESGKIMVHPRKEYLFKKNVLQYSNEKLEKITEKMINDKKGIDYYEFEGAKKIIAYKPVKPIGWSVGMTANYNEITDSIQKLKNYVFYIGIIIIIVICSILYFLINISIKPLNRLKTYMEIATEGDMTVQSEINSDDEIGALSKSFNTLINENRRLLEETIKYDKLKTEFFSNISHELKTPLNIVFSTAQLMELYNKDKSLQFDSKKLNKYIKIIRQNCYRQLRLVNNLIDISKIDSGFIKLNLTNKNIVEVVENITISTVEYVKGNNREIIFDTDIEEKIMAFDPEQMERIILNLISNAVKFTQPSDKIEVSIHDMGQSILISVKDSGMGIPEEKQQFIFQRFGQINSLQSRKHEGSGIGLSLVKSLVELHGGNISLKSKFKEGTEFIIEIPVKFINEEYQCGSNNLAQHFNVEKIHIEFSDIYG